MCGIITRIGEKKSIKTSIEILKQLEYRGYDSFGIGFLNDKNVIELKKKIGSIDKEFIEKYSGINSCLEIGHTRWATHGRVNLDNSHPHYSNNKKFFIVMNGIIENFQEIKKELENKNYFFYSQTDTEIIVALCEIFDKDFNNLFELSNFINKKLQGDFSYVLTTNEELVVYKKSNPIIIGKNKDEIIISSDNNLVQKYSDEYFLLENNSYLYFKNILFKDFKFIKDHKICELKWNKSNYLEDNSFKNTKYYMEKEIYEQEKIFNIYSQNNINFLNKLKEKIISEKNIYLLGAGTSYHAAILMHYKLLENQINSQVILASEVNNYINVIKDAIFIVFSQSGETADLISPINNLKNYNEVFSIINTKNSTLDLISNNSFYLNCGQEISVASTKAFFYQVFVSFMLDEILKNKKISIEKIKEVSNLISIFIKEKKNYLKEISNLISKEEKIFFIGRDIFYPIAIEAALKLKEVSYINSQGFAGGELKHGSLALISDSTPVISFGSTKEIYSNLIECETRGARIFDLSILRNENFKGLDLNYEIFFNIISLQFIAFFTALNVGNNPDKPRNLAKSVTVK